MRRDLGYNTINRNGWYYGNKEENKLDIVGLGTIAMDVILEVDKLPAEDGFSIIKNKTELDGGSGSNAIAQASKLGASCGFIAQLGDDDIGIKIKEGLVRDDVDISSMVLKKDSTSLHTQIVVGECGKKFILLNMGDSFLALDKDNVNMDYISSAKVFYTDLLPKDPAIYALEEAKKRRMNTVFNLQVGLPTMSNFGISKDEIIEELKYVDVFAPCREAFYQLTGANNLEEGLKEIRNYFPGIILLTLGSEGSIAFTGDKIVKIPVYKIDAKDTTGAGDSYIGSFMFAYYVKNMHLKKAMEFASICAGITCMKIGARSGPSEDRVEEILNIIKKQ